ncbi:hypothetical protein K430107D3_36870 [Dysosmobacter welbionis]
MNPQINPSYYVYILFPWTLYHCRLRLHSLFSRPAQGEGDESRRNRHSNQKNKKTSKKVLTKGEGFGILTKLSAR